VCALHQSLAPLAFYRLSCFCTPLPPPSSPLFPYTTLFRSRKSITGQSLDEAGGLCRGRGVGPEEGADPAEESVELGADEAEEGLSGCGRGHSHAEGDEPGDDEHGQLQAGDALAVEQGDAFGVDELRPHPQSGDEGRGHALAALVEEL